MIDLDVKTVVALVSAIVSVVAVYVNFRLWRAANRPIVTAEIRTHGDAGNIAIAYDLVVRNCGNRPATNIQLSALATAVESALTSAVSTVEKQRLLRCFSAKYQIPLLHQGDSVSNAFGATSSIPQENSLNYEAKIPVVITYQDVDGRRFQSSLTLVIRDTTNFADSGWSDETTV